MSTRHIMQYMFNNMLGGMFCTGMNNMSYMNSGFGGCGIGNIWDYSDTEIFGSICGSKTSQFFGILGSKAVQCQQNNVAAKAAQAAKDNKAFNDALKVLGITKDASAITDNDYNETAIKAIPQATLDALKEPVNKIETKINDLETEQHSANEQLKSLTDLKAPNGTCTDNPATMIEEWQTEIDSYDAKTQQKEINDAKAKIRQLKELQKVWDAWNDPNGTKFKELKKLQNTDKPAAEAKVKEETGKIIEERRAAAEVVKELLPLMQNKAYKQNRSDLDDADGCGLSRLFGKKHYTVDPDTKNASEPDDITATDLRKLLHEYRKGDRNHQQKISTWLKNNPEIAKAFKAAAGDDRDKLSILNKVIKGEAFTKDS